MMILSQMMDILWQTAAAVVNVTTTSAWTFKLKIFEMRSTKCNGNALFAENKVYELYNLYNENQGLICGEILNSSCFDFFWNSLFEVVFILNFIFAVFFYHGATVTLRFHDSVLIFCDISCFKKSIYLVYNDSSDVCPCFSTWFPCFLRDSPQSYKK